MRRGGVLAALAVCACACVFGASATAVATQQDVNPFGFWQKTLGNGKFLEEIMEAKETLTKQLEATKHTMEGERFRPPGGRTRPPPPPADLASPPPLSVAQSWQWPRCTRCSKRLRAAS